MRKQKVLISGGGVPGLSLALALSRVDLDITLIEPKPPEAFSSLADQTDGRTAAIMDDNIAWLESLGIWDRVKPYTAPLKTMRIIDDSIPGRTPAPPYDFHSSDIDKAAFAWNTPIQLLRAALWEMLPPSLNIIPAKAGNSDTGSRWGDVKNDYDLLIAADGRHSPLREAANITARFEDTGQAALTFVVQTETPHENISTEFQRLNGPVTFVPLPHPHQCSVVFVDKRDAQEVLQASDISIIEDELKKIRHTGLHRDDNSLRIITPPTLIPLTFMKVDRLYKNNTILMAEAAHVLHPLGAQGLNLSLKDASVLSDLIEKSLQTGMKINDTLHVCEAYEKSRKGDHGFRELAVKTSLEFLRRGQWTGGIRRGVLSLLDKSQLIKKTLLRFAG